MSITYEEAKAREAEARAVVEGKVAARDEKRGVYEAARSALKGAEQTREAAKNTLDELQQRLRATREAIMPNKAATKRAALELASTEAEYAAAQQARQEGERRLAQLERERDEVSALLDGAQENLERTGEFEISSRVSLDERVQRATDAQRSLDAAMRAVEEAQADVKKAQRALDDALELQSSLPADDDPLERMVRTKNDALQKAVDASKKAASDLTALREGQVDAEKAAQKAKGAYEQAQVNLRTAIAAADKAEAHMRDVQQRAAIGDEAALAEQTDAVAAFAAAGDVRSAAMTVNARALTELADADVEAIRIRIACDEAAMALDEANATRARTERELREAKEAVRASQSERSKTADFVSTLEARLADAKANLERVELVNREAAEENALAQKGLREMQEQAVLYGQQSRDAASALDGRRHELSDIVSSVELARVELQSLKRKEQQGAERADAARHVSESAERALAEAQGFIARAEAEIERQQSIIADTERRIEGLAAAFRKADEAYSTAQRDLEVANADLTDAEVSVFMAEINERVQ